MNIWVVNHYAVPPSGPSGTRHHATAAAMIRRGHEVTVIASSFDHTSRKERRLKPGEVARLETIDGVPFLWVRSSPYGGYARRIYNMAEFALRVSYGKDVRKLPRADIILGSTLTLFAALGAYRMARKLGVPFVLEVRDVWPQTLIDFGMSRWNPGVVMFGMIERHLYRNADAIITLLPGAVEHIRANGAKTQEIIWLPNAVDFTVAPPPSKPRDDSPFRVVFAGAHSPANSPETLLSAAAILQDRGRRDIQILFVGDGPSKTKLKRLSAEKQLLNIEFRDPSPKREIYDVLSEAGAAVALLKDLTLYRFGMSLNKLYDYMASARPVLFAARSLNDPVSESGCGIVVPPENPEALADAIIKLAEMTSEERWQMGLRGRRYVEEGHDFAKLSAKLEDLMIRTMDLYRASGPHQGIITK
jgi:glycosyltransferase involved in cell wall biosynthesis